MDIHILSLHPFRCTTACLLCYLAAVYPTYALVFQFLIALDVSSHYMHMYRYRARTVHIQPTELCSPFRPHLVHMKYFVSRSFQARLVNALKRWHLDLVLSLPHSQSNPINIVFSCFCTNSSLTSGATSHKKISESSNFILRAYYSNNVSDRRSNRRIFYTWTKDGWMADSFFLFHSSMEQLNGQLTHMAFFLPRKNPTSL